MIHTIQNPFPFYVKGIDWAIIDEECRCGQLRSEHADTVAYGHGAAPGCPQFTWVGWVVKQTVRKLAQCASCRDWVRIEQMHRLTDEECPPAWYTGEPVYLCPSCQL